MLKIVRRGKRGIFQIVGRHPLTGGRVRESTGLVSEPHAEAERIKLEQRLLDERTYGKRATTTFSEAVIVYRQKGHSTDRFVGVLNEHFGMRQLSAITDLDVMKFAALHYPNAQPQTVDRQVYTPMVAIWREAHAAGMCGPHEFRRPKKPEREAVRPASDEQIAALLAISDAASNSLREHPSKSEKIQPWLSRTMAAILLLSFTGARASEVCRIAPADIDWVAQTVLLRKTKNGKPRQVPLAPMVLEALLPLRQAVGPICGYANRWQLNRALETACKAAGVPVMTSHQIGRHAFAARLLRQGKTLKEVQEAGGWSAASMPMIAATYAHLEKSAVDAAVREADGPLARLVKLSRKEIA